MKKENLVALVGKSNSTHTHVVSISNPDTEGLKINLKKQTWKYKQETREYNIGDLGINGRRAGRTGEHVDGVVGVYDRTNITHLQTMIYHARAVIEESNDWSIADD